MGLVVIYPIVDNSILFNVKLLLRAPAHRPGGEDGPNRPDHDGSVQSGPFEEEVL